MSDISIVELGIYVFLELFSLSMLIISVVKEIPDTRQKSIIRSIYLIPGMIAAAFMAQTGQHITFNTILHNSTTYAANKTLIGFTNSTEANFIVLQNPVWGYFHILIFFVLFMFVINQMYNLLTKTD